MTAPASGAHATAVPGERMLHPVPLAALALLLLNDHALKHAFPSWWTGKLSDMAGLAFFPLFLQSLWEWGCAASRRFGGHSAQALALCAVATGLVFTLVKTWPPATDAYGLVWGVLGWPISAAHAWLDSRALPPLTRAPLVADPTDLLALPFLAVAIWAGRKDLPSGRPPAPEG